MTPAKKRASSRNQPERRQRTALREAVQDLLQHVRSIADGARTMSDDERSYAEERLEWLADEVWRTMTELEEGEL